MTAIPKVMIYSRDSIPRQDDLYDELERLGVVLRHVGELTPSRRANLILLPAELCALRLQGYRILHLHWLFDVQPRGSSRWLFSRRISRRYLLAVLHVSCSAGIAVIWTVHNVLPHELLMQDQVQVRQQLTALCSAVVVHSRATLAALTAMGCEPRQVAVIRPGAPHVAYGAVPTSRNETRSVVRALFIGRIEAYKGVEDLLEVAASLGAPDGLELVIAGECRDAALTARLASLFAKSRVRVEMHIAKLSEDALTAELARADLVVLPFRDVTSSGSVDLALAAGRPVVIPALPSLDEIPAACAWRYDGTINGLRAALSEAVSTSPERRGAMSEAAQRYASQLSWSVAARATYELFSEVLRLNAENFRGNKIWLADGNSIRGNRR